MYPYPHAVITLWVCSRICFRFEWDHAKQASAAFFISLSCAIDTTWCSSRRSGTCMILVRTPRFVDTGLLWSIWEFMFMFLCPKRSASHLVHFSTSIYKFLTANYQRKVQGDYRAIKLKWTCYRNNNIVLSNEQSSIEKSDQRSCGPKDIIIFTQTADLQRLTYWAAKPLTWRYYFIFSEQWGPVVWLRRARYRSQNGELKSKKSVLQAKLYKMPHVRYLKWDNSSSWE